MSMAFMFSVTSNTSTVDRSNRHQPGPADEVRAKRVLRHLSRQRDGHVAGQGRDAAAPHDPGALLLRAGKKPDRRPKSASTPSTLPIRAPSTPQLTLPIVPLGCAGPSVVPCKTFSPTPGRICHSARADPASSATAAGPGCGRKHASHRQGANSPRNARANGDVRISPAAQSEALHQAVAVRRQNRASRCAPAA